jgi:hypothetical protein
MPGYLNSGFPTERRCPPFFRGLASFPVRDLNLSKISQPMRLIIGVPYDSGLSLFPG